MNTKSSAHYQREYRKRLREQGLIKKEVWIRPENTQLLSAVEKQLRSLDVQALADLNQQKGEQNMTENAKNWTTVRLHEALKASELCAGDAATIELLEGVEPTVHIIMHDYGDLPIFLTVSGDQIIVESVLWPMKDIIDVAEFNEAVLMTHKYFPLSTISLDKMADGTNYYHMFGALSSASFLQHIVFEIEVLASNVIQATSAYNGFLKMPIEA